MKKTTQLWASAAPLAFGFALIASPALAQDAAPADETAEEAPADSTIVVTGSRIQSPNVTAISPVTSVNAADIKLSGTQKTEDLLKGENRADQVKALRSNRESQKLSEEAAKGYRRFLLQQREQLAAARKRTAHDLRIADNTFETVEASFQLRNLMRDSTASFEAIQKLESPTFEQIFKNEELRREFENLTRKLDAPTS